MSAAHKATAAFAAILALALVIFLHEWHNKGIDLAAMEATLKAQHSNLAALEHERAMADQQRDLRIAALEAEKKNIVTPAQAVKEIPVYLPQNLPAPVTPTYAPAPVGAPAGTPPTLTGMQIPTADMKPLFDQLVDYKECGVKLTTAVEQTSIDEHKIQSLEKELDAAVKAAKGGSVWSRVKHDGKLILAGGVLGGLLVAAARK